MITSEVVYKRQQHKLTHSESHANKTQNTGVKQKHYQNVNKCHKCIRCGRVQAKNNKYSARDAECIGAVKAGSICGRLSLPCGQ